MALQKIDKGFVEKLRLGKKVRVNKEFVTKVFRKGFKNGQKNSTWYSGLYENNVLNQKTFLSNICKFYLWGHIVANKDLDVCGELPGINVAKMEQDKLMKRLEQQISLYTFVASFGEIRHGKGMINWFRDLEDGDESLDSRQNNLFCGRMTWWKKAFDTFPVMSLEERARMFVYFHYWFERKSCWTKQMGGRLWGVPSLLYLEHYVGLLDDKQYIDTVLSHEHNCGSFFNKCFSGDSTVKSLMEDLFNERFWCFNGYIKGNDRDVLLKYTVVVERLISERWHRLNNKSKCAEFRNDVKFAVSA